MPPLRFSPSPACRIVALLACAAFLLAPSGRALAGPKALFDNTKAETAGNADWIIDDTQPVPFPAQSGIDWTTAETYWTGAASSWGVQLVKRGYTVATLTTSYGITYQNPANPYDLSNYDLFVLIEPNIRFTAAESTAIFHYVADGGGLIAVSDHDVSDRNNDGYDSPKIYDLLDSQHLWGVHYGSTGDANNNIVQTTTNMDPAPTDSIIHGAAGVATALAYHNGTTFTLYPNVNPSVRANAWMLGTPTTSLTGVMLAQSVYGNGRIVFEGDSSPVDDGTGTPGNSLFAGWAEANGADSLVFLNASLWATRRTAPGDVTPPLVHVTSPDGGETWKAGSAHALTWTATDDVGVTAVDLALSTDGGASYPTALASGLANTGTFAWSVPDLPGTALRVRATAHDAAGHATSDASDGNFAIDRWTITASAGPFGAVAPSGAVGVVEGASAPFTFTPAAGCAVSDVVVDGGSVGAPAGWTFPDVSADHTLAVTFADVTPPTVAVLAPNGGEAWDLGAAHAITWSAADNAGVDSLTIEVSYHGPDGPWSMLASGLANSGSWPWTVAGEATDSALVRVTAFDAGANTALDASDSAFAIVDPLVAVGDAGPVAFAFLPPAPNPSSGAATLFRFALPAAGSARLDVFDLAGRRLWSGAGRYAAGTTTVRWDGRTSRGTRAPSGMLFVRLTTPFGVRTARLLRLP